MIKIILIIKPDCMACGLVKKIITNAVNNIDSDITLRVLNSELVRDEQYNVKVYPTTIIKKNDKELARLEGSFPVDYLNKVIDKLKEE